MNDEDVTSWVKLSRRERNGAYGLIILLVVVISINPMIQRFYHPQITITADQRIMIDSILNQRQRFVQKSKPNSLDLHPFDPNKVSKKSLVEMGIPSKLANTWANYTAAGGTFKSSPDLLKLYHMDTALYQQLQQYIIIPNTTSTRAKKTREHPSPNQSYEIEKRLFEFDPNTVSNDSLRLLDLPRYVVNNLIKYRASGGQFYKAEQLKKLYGLSDTMYQRIQPYIRIDTSLHQSSPRYTKREMKTTTPLNINLNQATKSQLVLINNIGAYRAQEIINRRENIGGFHHISQLYDGIWSIDSALVDEIMPHLYVDSSYNYIDLKNISIWELSKHHYFDENMAKMAINYFHERDQADNIQKFIDTNPLPKERWEKVKAYLIRDMNNE